MDDEERNPPEVSFIIHLWLEQGAHWRGRVSDGDGTKTCAFEDTDSLLAFIQERLQRASKSGMSLPSHRLSG